MHVYERAENEFFIQNLPEAKNPHKMKTTKKGRGNRLSSRAAVLFLLATMTLIGICSAQWGGDGGDQNQGEKDLYKILGVEKTATDKEIKKAFRKLSKKYHPDRNQDRKEWAKKKFVEVANAYEVLKDPQKRRQYDRGDDFGDTFFSRNQGGDFDDLISQFFKQAGFGGDPFGDAFGGGFGFGDDDDMFGGGGGGHYQMEMNFGGGGGGGGRVISSSTSTIIR